VITESLAGLVRTALEKAAAEGVIDGGELPDPEFERPRNRAHGDWSTNVALKAGRFKGSPREVAAAIAARLPENDLVEGVDVAGPGFLNFRLAPTWLHDVVRRAAAPTGRFGFASEPTGRRFNVEYVSANPTGPVNVVSGRHAAVGDAIANLLEAVGHEVTREFYVNDAGRQVTLFAQSIAARYLQLLGHEAAVPEDGYQGDYVTELAREIAAEYGPDLSDLGDEERVQRFKELGLQRMKAAMQRSLEAFGTKQEVWFSEAALHDSGAVKDALDKLRSAGLVEERDGALWFLSSRLGDDKDRVVVRSNGETTYLASDLAYLIDKFGRGHDHLIYLWGADHHGTIARLLAGAEALGLERERVEVALVQIVTLLSGGEAIKASKRAGVIVPLDELVAEVGRDAARYTFLSRALESPLEFDIELAKEEGPENPVYYVQYAHARICSILRRAEEAGVRPDPAAALLRSLQHPSEDELMRKLASYEDVVPDAASMRTPQKITRYLEELAAVFSAFYRDCRVMEDDEGLMHARLVLCMATRGVLSSGLGLLGVGAPERM
jgi:arginyl-tRNA synthetase